MTRVRAQARGLRDDVVDALDEALLRLRRSFVLPAVTGVTLPSLGQPLDLAKIVACSAIVDLQAAHGEPVTVKDLASALQLEHSTVSRLVGEIEAEGLLVRGVDSRDRRRTTLVLTATGEAVVADARRLRRFVARTVLHGWTPEEVETLTRLLGRLADTASEQATKLPELIQAEFGPHRSGSSGHGTRR